MRLGPVLKSGLSFTLALGASALRAQAEVMLRSALRQQGLVTHHYSDIFNRTRRMHAALDSLRMINFKTRVKVVQGEIVDVPSVSFVSSARALPPGHRTFFLP
jgi:arginine/ornithine N-succinyltransferase beta subunit